MPDGVGVVSAFHTVSAACSPTSVTGSTRTCCCVATAATTRHARAELVERIEGLRAVDCGPLEMARIVEQLTPLIISINVRNKVRAGIKITGSCERPVVVLAGGTGGAKLARGHARRGRPPTSSS